MPEFDANYRANAELQSPFALQFLSNSDIIW